MEPSSHLFPFSPVHIGTSETSPRAPAEPKNSPSLPEEQAPGTGHKARPTLSPSLWPRKGWGSRHPSECPRREGPFQPRPNLPSHSICLHQIPGPTFSRKAKPPVCGSPHMDTQSCCSLPWKMPGLSPLALTPMYPQLIMMSPDLQTEGNLTLHSPAVQEIILGFL